MPPAIPFFPKVLCCLIVIPLLFCISCRSHGEENVGAENGKLNLRDADIVGTAVPLDGEWKFLWNIFLPPESDVWNRPEIAVAEMPGTWNDIAIDGSALPDTGYCSMQLRITLPPEAGELGIKVNNVGTAYRLFADRDLILENGVIGTSREGTRASYQPRTAYFEPKGREIVLTMHISNFHDRMGGAWTRMYIGDAEGISKKHYADGSIDMLLFGMFFIIGIYYLISWFFGGRKRAFFWFALTSFMIAVRTLSAGEIYLMSLFPRLGFELNHKIQLSSQPALVSFFLLSLKNVYPKEISNTAVKIFLGIMTLYCAVIWAVPLIVHSYLLVPFHIVVALLGCYIAYGVFRASRCNRSGAKILFLGFLVLFLTTINDILYSISFIHTGYYVTIGIIVFSIAYVITLTKHKADQGPLSEAVADERILESLRGRGVSIRESEVVFHLLQGHTYDEIGDKLCIAKSTVTKHVHSIYRKLGTKNRVGLYEYVKRMRRDLEK